MSADPIADLFDTRMRDAFWRDLKDGKSRDCPCCDRHAQIYKRRLHKGMALALIRLYRLGGAMHFIHIASFTDHVTGFDVAFTRHWGLVESEELPDDVESKKTSGRWKLTLGGSQFVRRHSRIPTYVLTYNDKVLGFEGEGVSISDCLGEKFNYGELMRGIAA